MLTNYLKIAWRNLLSNKSFSLINISGLAIGMAAAVLIFLWVQNEYSFNQFHKNKDRIYEVWNKDIRNGKTNCWNTTPKVMAKAIQKDYDEIDKMVRINSDFPILFTYGEKKIKATCNIVDSGFLQMMTFPLTRGDKNTCLNEVNSVVIGKDLAHKIFDDEDPIGKIVKLDNQYPFKISGVLEDLPSTTDMHFECLIPWRFLTSIGGDDEYWGNNSTYTLAMLKQNVSIDAFQDKIKNLRKRYDKDSPAMETFLYPLTRARLHGVFENGIEQGGRITIVRIFTIVAFLLLIIACINFMNLSTARSEKRAKEVGIRKVVGAYRYSLVAQFLGESILISFISGLIAVVIVYYSLNSFNALVDKKLFLNFKDFTFWLAAIGFVLFTGLMAGSYPALFLSSFRPVAVLKGTFRNVQTLITPRKVLVVGQFVFSILLIFATLIIKQQIDYAQARTSGYDKNHLAYHFMEGDVEKNYTLIKNELLKSGLAVSVTKTSSPITEGWSNTWGFKWPGKQPNDKTLIDRYCADDQIVKTMGLDLIAGRDLNLTSFLTDSSAAIINESAAKLMGITQMDKAVGMNIKDGDKDWHVIGVIKDFILHSPFHPTIPIVIEGAKGWFNVIHVKYADQLPMNQTLAAAELIFKKYNPEYPFNTSFADAEYEKKYSDEKRISKLATLFAGLTIFISCLGLFGLVSFMAANRTKELGVRKVLGASMGHIVSLLSMDFMKIVLIAYIIASPLGYWTMNNWLKEYPYRISIHWWVFGLSGLSILVIAMATVGIQAIRAAVSNPVKSLRTE